MSGYESAFKAWLQSLGPVEEIGCDRYRVDTHLSLDALARLPGFPHGDGSFPPECPISAGEGAYLISDDGREVAVFVEGWSETCLGGRDPSEVSRLGRRVLARWDKEVPPSMWRRLRAEIFDEDRGVTLLVSTRRSSAPQRGRRTPRRDR